jgi:flavin reductase (DIM6/NTAB) family NADH-FMN oxidoreductase RutF
MPEQNQPATAFDTLSFRRCLGQFPTGVCIITADVDGERLGMTVSSFNTLSLDPPLVLFSIDRSARSLGQWRSATAIAINVLSAGQTDISNRFASSKGPKWEGVTFRQSPLGAPILPGVAASMECVPHDEADGGDHILFIVRVTDFRNHPDRSPLVFCKGGYNRLESAGEQAAIWPLDIHYG